MLIINQNILEWIFRNLGTSKNILISVNVNFVLIRNLGGLYHTSTFEWLPPPQLYSLDYYKIIVTGRSFSNFISTSHFNTHTMYGAFDTGKQTSSA